MRTTWTSMGIWQPPIPSLCTFLALPWCDDFSIRNSSQDWGRHTHGFHLPSDVAKSWKTLEQFYHQIATVFRFSFEQDHLSSFHEPSLSSLATSKLMEPCLPKRTWFILNGFNFWWILRLLVLVLHEVSWYVKEKLQERLNIYTNAIARVHVMSRDVPHLNKQKCSTATLRKYIIKPQLPHML